MRKLVVMIIGVLLVACAEDRINKGSDAAAAGSISGTVTYSGQALIQRLGFAVSDSNQDPPTTMPVKMAYIPQAPSPKGLEFPVSYTISGLQPGTYYIKVYGDVDPDDGNLPNYKLDPQTPFVGPVVVTTAGTAVQDLQLMDDYEPGQDLDVITGTDADNDTYNDATVQPKPGKAAIYGTVTYTGSKTGTLYVAVFDSNPPAGPPKAMVRIAEPKFPQDYVIDNIPPGKVFAIAYLDTQNKVMLDPDDPATDYKTLNLQADSTAKQDFELKDPK